MGETLGVGMSRRVDKARLGVGTTSVRPRSSRSKRRTISKRLASPCAARIDMFDMTGSCRSKGSSVELAGDAGRCAKATSGAAAVAGTSPGRLRGTNGAREDALGPGASTKSRANEVVGASSSRMDMGWCRRCLEGEGVPARRDLLDDQFGAGYSE